MDSVIFHDCRNFVNSRNPKVETHTRQELCHFGQYVAKAGNYFIKNVSSRSPGLQCSYGKIFIPVTAEISVTGPARLLIANTSRFSRRKERQRQHLGNGASPVTRLARLTDEFCCTLKHNQNDIDLYRSRLLWTPVASLIKVITILLQWEYKQDKKHIPFWSDYVEKAKLLCQKCFVPVTLAGVLLWENFHLGYQYLGRKNRDLGCWASSAHLVWTREKNFT